MRRWYVIALMLCAGAARPAQAELYEKTIGMETGLLLPSFESRNPTDLTLATWSAGVIASYGITETVAITTGFHFSTFEGRAHDRDYLRATGDGLSSDRLDFAARAYRPTLGLRWNMYPGYAVAPYLEGALGYTWMAYTKTAWYQNEKEVARNKDFGEGALTASLGVACELRLIDLFFVGLAVRYTSALQDVLLRHAIHIPLTARVKFDL